MADVLILVGSESDKPRIEPAFEILSKAGFSYEFHASSAHLHVGARFHPLRIRAKRGPRRVPRSRIAVGEYVHELIEPGDGLPESDDGHPVLLEQRDRMVTKTGVQHVGRAACSHRVRAELEAARLCCRVLDVNAGTTRWRRGPHR